MTSVRLALPSVFELQKLLRYDPESGHLFWRERGRETLPDDHSRAAWNSRYAGAAALASKSAAGYLKGGLHGRQVFAHRVIWKLLYGNEPSHIDHISGDKANNRPSNLRASSDAHNAKNAKRSAANKSGVTGVSYSASRGLWCAGIKVDGRQLNLGRFTNREDAVAARKAAERVHGFSAGHGRCNPNDLRDAA